MTTARSNMDIRNTTNGSSNRRSDTSRPALLPLRGFPRLPGHVGTLQRNQTLDAGSPFPGVRCWCFSPILSLSVPVRRLDGYPTRSEHGDSHRVNTQGEISAQVLLVTTVSP